MAMQHQQQQLSFVQTAPPSPPPPNSVMEQHSPSSKSSMNISAQSSNQLSSQSPSFPVKSKPPVPQKPKSLVRAITQGSMTRFRTAKPTTDDSMGDKGKKEKCRQHQLEQLREQPLWKLPGLGTASRRHSTTEVASSPERKKEVKPTFQPLPELPPLPSTPPTLAVRPSSLPDIPSGIDILPKSLQRSPSPTCDALPPAVHSSTPPRPRTPQPSLISEEPVKPKDSDKTSVLSTAAVPPSNQVETSLQGKEGEALEYVSSIWLPSPQSFSIGDLLQKFSKSFPLRIKVLQGYCSETNDVTISTGDEYRVHFVKHTRTVKVKDEDGCVHSLPLGGSMRCGLIYNPNSNYDEALEGINFTKISDITASATLPKVVCSTQAWVSADDKVSIENNEVLIVRQIHKPMFGKKGLKVLSILTNSEKILPDECSGRFSTKPSLVRLHLPQIIEFIGNPFPCQAVMYSSTDVAQSGHHMHEAQSRVITMTECISETALVASVACDEVEPEEEMEAQMFDIPLDDELAEVEVVLLECKEEGETGEEDEDDHVYDDTINFAFLRRPSVEDQPHSEGNVTDEEDSPYDDTISVMQQYQEAKFKVVVKKDESPYAVASAPKPTTKDDEHNKKMDSKDGYATLPIRKDADQEVATNSSGCTREHTDKEDSCRVDLGSAVVNASWMQEIQMTTNSLTTRLESLEASQKLTDLVRYNYRKERLIIIFPTRSCISECNQCIYVEVLYKH